MAKISESIARMLQADFYPHPTVASIELIQTHASYVFLTGKYAFEPPIGIAEGFPYRFLTMPKHPPDRHDWAV